MERMGRSGVSKWDIRNKIWDYMEANNLADFPRPVHHRIPNFKGSFQMGVSIKSWEGFDQAREVKVDPDKPLEGIRLSMLQGRKTLLVPTPRLRTGLFNRIVPPPGATKETLRNCATSRGVRDYSVPVGLDAKVHVDLIVVGSVAVSEKGWRIGKGEGFADMEYAMMVSMGAVGERTAVITAVHDCQVVDIPEELLDDHDLTVDYILTPTRIIKTECKRPKPWGIMWHKISRETLQRIPVLKILHDRERLEGKDVHLKDERPDTLAAEKTLRVAGENFPGGSRSQAETSLAQPRREGEALLDERGHLSASATVYVGNISSGTRVSDLKEALRMHHVTPARLSWRGAQRQAFLSYGDRSKAEEAMMALKGLSLQGRLLRVEWARNQGGQNGAWAPLTEKDLLKESSA
ncbi:methenyltetrahydrofolate synthase domain-containing protein isoform X1 [Thamnophis elegans]|uniref:methenyltetrahydrofolate synthase domain-containing protein isoform X1 n=2 Tax=Thamnophis elegans TaxID=35005 RepID=UPI0013769D48|nr:methenyltetrahydrofolate synthase domain-containing protein isoform X1 [Thamnophis elegans]